MLRRFLGFGKKIQHFFRGRNFIYSLNRISKILHQQIEHLEYSSFNIEKCSRMSTIFNYRCSVITHFFSYQFFQSFLYDSHFVLKVCFCVHSTGSKPFWEPSTSHWIEIQRLIFPLLIANDTKTFHSDPRSF